MRGCSVIVLAAGKGTRMKSELPKVLHDLCGRSLLGHALFTSEGVNPSHVITVVRHERDLVAAEAKRVRPGVIIADQDEIPGTGRAVQCALDTAANMSLDLGDTVVVTSGDVPLLEAETLRKLLERHEQNQATVTLMTTIVEDPTGYGRVVREGQRVKRIVEHRDATRDELAIKEINAAIYAFDREFLEKTLKGLGRSNDQGEVYLTDVVELADKAGLVVQAFELEDNWQAEGCNDLVQLAGLRRVLNRRLLDKFMLAGARVVDPESTSIDVTVRLEPDSRVEPFTVLKGETVVQAGVTVGPFEVITDKNCSVGLQ